MNTVYHPGYFLRIDRRYAQLLMLDRRNFFVCNPTEKITHARPKSLQFVDALKTIAEASMDEAVRTIQRNPRRLHYYFEHSETVDYRALAMAIDYTKDQDGWHESRAKLALTILYTTSFAAHGWGKPAYDLMLKSLPTWTVCAPVSLMMRATSAPNVSVNTRGMGPRLINQPAFRLGDIESVFGFLKIPYYIYARTVAARYAPRSYLKECIKYAKD